VPKISQKSVSSYKKKNENCVRVVNLNAEPQFENRILPTPMDIAKKPHNVNLTITNKHPPRKMITSPSPKKQKSRNKPMKEYIEFNSSQFII